jgi:hypothetical protein
MPTTVAVIGPNLWDQSKGLFHIHSASCRDGLNPRKYPQSERHEVEISSQFDVLEFIYADHAGDDGHEPGSEGYINYLKDCGSDFYFHNCVNVPEDAAPVSEEIPAPELLIDVLRSSEEPVKFPNESVQEFIDRVSSTVQKPTETLVCRQCGSSFTRTIVRGRKPHRCPTCKGGK